MQNIVKIIIVIIICNATTIINCDRILFFLKNIRSMKRNDENVQAHRLSLPARNQRLLLLSGTMAEMQG